MKNKIEIVKWLKQNFVNSDELSNFCEFEFLHHAKSDGSKVLLPYYENKYNELTSNKFIKLYDEINALPEITITERFGNETHKTLRTPMNYIQYFYNEDEKRRRKLFA